MITLNAFKMATKIIHCFLSFIIILNATLICNSLNIDDDNPLIPLYPRAFTITQRLDHFNKSDTRLWEQKYYINGENYAKDGPVFVQVTGSIATSSTFIINDFQWIRWAKKYNALCIVVEQRFYGYSQPTGDVSLESLEYFTLEQALEDLVDFRTMIAYRHKLQNKKWVFFGAENGGVLAVNLRMKYPSLVDGVIASCTPMIYKVDGSESLNNAFKIIDKSSPPCVSAIASAVNQIEEYFKEGASSWANLSSKFQVCGALDGKNRKQVEYFYYYLAKEIYNIVLLSEEHQDVTVDSMCEIMNDTLKGPEIDRLAHVIMLHFKSKNSKCVINVYEKSVKYANTSSLQSAFKDVRMNWYLFCSRVGFLFGSDDPKMPFHSKFSISFLLERCADLFGPQYDANFVESKVNETNEKFGSGAINAQLTNVIFVSGSDDPERPRQLSNDINSEAKVITIKGASHCSDILPSTIYDSEQLIKARSAISHEINDWINS